MWDKLKKSLQDQIRDWAYQYVITPVEAIDIIRGDGLSEHDVLAQIDLLHDESMIDAQLAKDIGIYYPETVNERREYIDSSGKKHLSDVIAVSFTLQGVERTSRWLVTNRQEEKHLVCLGKNDVAGFYIFVQPVE